VGESAKKLLSQALRLSLDERAQLAADLIASIDGEPDEDAEAAWAAEIERRPRARREVERAPVERGAQAPGP
jgi:putative addiction module component (TIGR02574 family)